MGGLRVELIVTTCGSIVLPLPMYLYKVGIVCVCASSSVLCKVLLHSLFVHAA